VDITLSALPPNVLSQIPISLRVNKTNLNYDTLPRNLQLLLIDYIESIYSKPPNTSLEFISELGEYGDWFGLSSTRDVVLEYIQNWFKIPFGSYPFDPTFGTRLKTYLHTKDTSLRNQLINNEMRVIENLINVTYTSSFTILSSTVTPKEFADHTEYFLEMNITLLNTPLTISITQ